VPRAAGRRGPLGRRTNLLAALLGHKIPRREAPSARGERHREAALAGAVRLVALSYPLSPSSPVYPGNEPVQVTAVASMAAGDAANVYRFCTLNHNGSHVDAPRHFNPDGPSAGELPLEAFVFGSPLVVDVPKVLGEMITGDDLRAVVGPDSGADLLLVRTGSGALRDRDPVTYAERNPSLHPSAARYVADELPTVRAIGLDSISAGSPLHREEGREAHRILTGVGRSDGRFVLIYEDLRLPMDLPPLGRVWALPLVVAGTDSAPVVVVGEVD